VSTAEVLSTVAVIISGGSVLVGLLRFSHERKMADHADARSVLAEGALEVLRMKSVLKDALTKFGMPLRGSASWPPDFHEQIGKLEVAGEELESALAALRIRFPQTDDSVVELDAALQSARSLISIYTTTRGDEFGGSSGGGREAHREALSMSATFDRHRDAYLAAAQTAVGVSLD
jgi:hypothetical protein